MESYKITTKRGISSGGIRFRVRNLWLMVCAVASVSFVPAVGDGVPVDRHTTLFSSILL